MVSVGSQTSQTLYLGQRISVPRLIHFWAWTQSYQSLGLFLVGEAISPPEPSFLPPTLFYLAVPDLSLFLNCLPGMCNALREWLANSGSLSSTCSLFPSVPRSLFPDNALYQLLRRMPEFDSSSILTLLSKTLCPIKTQNYFHGLWGPWACCEIRTPWYSHQQHLAYNLDEPLCHVRSENCPLGEQPVFLIAESFLHPEFCRLKSWDP